MTEQSSLPRPAAVQHDMVARIHFLGTAEGGRQTPIVQPRFGCLFEHAGQLNDCFLLLDDVGMIRPGQDVTVRMKFLYPDLVRPRIVIGDAFTLREARTIASGTVSELAV